MTFRMAQVKRSKYGATPTTVDGIRFHSAKEASRYGELKLLEKAGEIRELRLQPEFPLWVHDGVVEHGPLLIGNYRGDFAYEERHVTGISLRTRKPVAEWADVIEDVKGFKTPLYRWKKKHVEAQYGIEIRET